MRVLGLLTKRGALGLLLVLFIPSFAHALSIHNLKSQTRSAKGHGSKVSISGKYCLSKNAHVASQFVNVKYWYGHTAKIQELQLLAEIPLRLQAGSCYSMTRSIQLPSMVQHGARYLHVSLEKDYQKIWKRLPLQITGKPLLEVTILSLEKGKNMPDNQRVLRFRVQNTGSVAFTGMAHATLRLTSVQKNKKRTIVLHKAKIPTVEATKFFPQYTATTRIVTLPTDMLKGLHLLKSQVEYFVPKTATKAKGNARMLKLPSLKKPLALKSLSKTNQPTILVYKPKVKQ